MIYLIIGDKQFSSWSMRASIILKEKKIDYKEIIAGLDWPIKFTDKGLIPINEKDDYDLPEEPASGCACQLTQLLKIDPTNLLMGSISELLPRVPILIDTNTKAVITDVLAIHEYLEENFPNSVSLLGDDITVRSEIRSFSSHIHADLLPLMSGMSYSNSFRTKKMRIISEEALEQLKDTLNLVEKLLKRENYTGDYLFGNFSLADCMFSPIAQQINGWNIEVKSPIVKNYINLLLERQSIKHYLFEANEPYRLLEESEENSPSWIARHYRYWSDIKMLHDSQRSVYHVLENEVSSALFEQAYSGKNLDELTWYMQTEFELDESTAKRDIKDFFESIHPNKKVLNQLSL
jgi:glutathione S-transferase